MCTERTQKESDEGNCKISPFKFYITHKMADNIILYFIIQFFGSVGGDEDIKRENIFLSRGMQRVYGGSVLIVVEEKFPFFISSFISQSEKDSIEDGAREMERRERISPEDEGQHSETLCIHIIDFGMKINSVMRYFSPFYISPLCFFRFRSLECYIFLMFLSCFILFSGGIGIWVIT